MNTNQMKGSGGLRVLAALSAALTVVPLITAWGVASASPKLSTEKKDRLAFLLRKTLKDRAEGRTTKILVRFPETLVDRATELANLNDTSRNEFFVKAVTSWVLHLEQQPSVEEMRAVVRETEAFWRELELGPAGSEALIESSSSRDSRKAQKAEEASIGRAARVLEEST